MLHAGIATHFCESSKIPELEKTLLSLKNTSDVDKVVHDYCPKPNSEFTLAKHLDKINNIFTASSIEEILNNLEKDNSEWAKQTNKVFTFLLIIDSHFSKSELIHCIFMIKIFRRYKIFRQPV